MHQVDLFRGLQEGLLPREAPLLLILHGIVGAHRIPQPGFASTCVCAWACMCCIVRVSGLYRARRQALSQITPHVAGSSADGYAKSMCAAAFAAGIRPAVLNYRCAQHYRRAILGFCLATGSVQSGRNQVTHDFSAHHHCHLSDGPMFACCTTFSEVCGQTSRATKGASHNPVVA